jgi:hypothetical protein
MACVLAFFCNVILDFAVVTGGNDVAKTAVVPGG